MRQAPSGGEEQCGNHTSLWVPRQFLLAACGGTTEERAATGGLGGAAAGAVVGGPVGAVVGAAAGATGGAVMDEGVDEKVGEATASEATASQATASGADVLEKIQGSGQFSTFSQAVEATDLKDTLAGDGPFTVFAPTDDAFAQLPEGAVDELMTPENRDELRPSCGITWSKGRVWLRTPSRRESIRWRAAKSPPRCPGAS